MESVNRKKAEKSIKKRNMEVIYGRKVTKEDNKEESKTSSLSRSMSYAEGRFNKTAGDSDDSFGEDGDFMAKGNMQRRGGAFASKVQN